MGRSRYAPFVPDSRPKFNEGLPVDLFRERNRPQRKASSSNYQLGSNIQCLHTHDIGNAEPQKPSSRVRDVGKAIMINANKCTWYQAMTEGAELDEKPRVFPSVEVEPSQEAEAPPSPPPSDTDPTSQDPRAPTREPLGLPALGKDTIVKTEAASDAFTNPSVTKSISECSISDDNMQMLKRLEEQQIELMNQQQALRLRIGMQMAGHNSQPCHNDSKPCHNDSKHCHDPKTCRNDSKPCHDPKTCRNDSKPCVVSDQVNDEFEVPGSPLESQPQPTVSQDFYCPSSLKSTSIMDQDLRSTLISHGASTARFDSAAHRRLKGNVAQRCALRDEGSIKNLIWNNEEGDNESNNHALRCMRSLSSIPFDARSSASSLLSTPMQRKQSMSCAVIAESSKTVQDLLANSFSSTL